MKTAMQEVLEKCQDESITLEELGKWVSMSAYMLLEKKTANRISLQPRFIWGSIWAEKVC